MDKQYTPSELATILEDFSIEDDIYQAMDKPERKAHYKALRAAQALLRNLEWKPINECPDHGEFYMLHSMYGIIQVKKDPNEDGWDDCNMEYGSFNDNISEFTHFLTLNAIPLPKGDGNDE